MIAVYLLALWYPLSEAQARGLAFTTIVVGNVTLLFVQRAGARSALQTLRTSHNTPAALLSLSALTVLALALTVAPVAGFFRFELPPASALAFAVAVGLASLLWLGRSGYVVPAAREP